MLHLARYVLLGPVLGACLGLIQTAVAAGVWASHGQPDFYFRGWDAVWRNLVMWSAGGLIVGVPFGAAVAAGEYLLGRRVWISPALVSVIVATAGATWALVEFEFSRRELLPPFALEGTAVAIAIGLLPVFSRRTVAPNR